MDLAHPIGEAALLREGGLERAHLLAGLLQLRAQPLALTLCLRRLALHAFALGALLLGAGAAGTLDVATQALHLRPHLFEPPARVRQLGFQSGHRQRGLELGRGVVLGRPELILALALVLALRLLGRRIGRGLVERAKGNDRARSQAVVVEVGVTVQRRLDPFDHRAVTAPEARQGIPAGRGDLQGLEEAVELEALAHSDRDERHGHLELLAVLAAHHGLQLPTAGGQRVGQAERLHQRTPEHACTGPAEQLLGRPAPARDGALAVGQDEAGVHELAEQLLDGLRGGVRGEGVVGHTGSVFGRPLALYPRSGTSRAPICVYERPCSRAPLTPASSAFRRYSASASAERKRRPGSDSAP